MVGLRGLGHGVTSLVLAAGSASRFGAPKQFQLLAPGVRLVDAAVRMASAVSESVILVLPPGHLWDGARVFAITTGGATRLESVGRGLEFVPAGTDVILVHDAAHPITPRRIFVDLIEAIREGEQAAVPFLPVPDVVKRRDSAGSLTTVGRDGLGLAQVPMAFRPSSLLLAHSQAGYESAWEDSMLIEMAGGRVGRVSGSTRNIHVVTPEDLEIVRELAARGLES